MLPKNEMEKHALSLLVKSKMPEVNTDYINPDRIRVLVSIGSAFAVNCTSTLNNYISLSESVEITSEDLNKIFKTATIIKRKASSHVDRVAVRLEEQSGKSNECKCEKSESSEQIIMNKIDKNVEKPCC